MTAPVNAFSSGPVWYFAYGSNMNPKRMQARGLQPKNIVPASLEHYRLCFNKRAHGKDGVAYANIEAAAGEKVFGVAYELEGEVALRQLDHFEGTPVRYSRERFLLLSPHGPLPAWVYVANPAWRASDLKPEANYLKHLLAGSQFLPESYRAAIENTECWPANEYAGSDEWLHSNL